LRRGDSGEPAVRASKVMMTPPLEPVVICANGGLQEEPMPEEERHTLRVPKLVIPAPPAGDANAVVEAAKMLGAADNPVIVAGRVARTPDGIKLLVELAETLQADVIDRKFRMNFPSRHPLFNTAAAPPDLSRVVAGADVVLGLEVPDFWNATHAQTPINRMGMTSRPITKPGAKLITITSGDLFSRSNYQDFGRYAEVDLAIAADAEATLPSLIEACKRLMTPERKRIAEERGRKLAEEHKRTRDRDFDLAAVGWD